ncbi:MAG: Fic family protein [Deltaproteobacteria bacterium]|nr:Fic family protein [Deltaproteobacteria bacterium]
MSYDFDDFDVRVRFSELDDRMEELNGLIAQMPEERPNFDEKCRIAYIYHDNALDGIVLTYPELRAAVDRQIASDSSLIPTYQEIKNHCDALDVVMDHCNDEMGNSARARNPKITVQLVYDLHVLLSKNLPRKKPGLLRQEMPLHRTYFHTISDPENIEEGLEKVCELLGDSDFRAQHPINQACLFHYEFMCVFPFSNGAGKVGRLLLNYFLMRAGYLPAVIHACDRQRYYETLKKGPEALRGLIIDAMESAVDTGLRHLRECHKERLQYQRRYAR